MKKPMVAAAGVLSLLAPGVHAEEQAPLPVITVEDHALPDPVASSMPLKDAVTGMKADGGDLLRSIPGIAGNRMGGHAIDPIIRGQTQTQLNILLDGAYIHGGCPNRMDTPSSYGSAETYDKLTVIKGGQTVVYGGGGSGGTVLMERETLRFNEGEHLRSRFGTSYEGNSGTTGLVADVATGAQQGYIRFIGERKDADNYEDGDGNEVRSAFKQQSTGVLLGYTPNADTLVELNLEAVRGEDMLYAGANMDAPVSDSDMVRLKFDSDNVGGLFRNVKAELYHSDVTHLMDNYSLRTPPTLLNGMPNRMKVPSDSVTLGGRVMGEIGQGESTVWTIGMDRQQNDRDAELFAVGATGDMLTAFLWPDVRIGQTGLFGEMRTELDGANRFKAGLRYDRVDTSADKADTRPGTNRTPNEIYRTVYGVTAEDRTENNVGGFLRLEHDLGSRPVMLYTSLSRSLRTADASERYMARPNMDWVGNPGIDPEQHHQLEGGFAWNGGAWELTGSVYHDWVSDFILRDKARGQEGVLIANGTSSIYRNIEARLYGTELAFNRRWSNQWSTGLSLAYVHATNTSDDRPIAQIPPLEANLLLGYRQANWMAGGKLRLVSRQEREDLLSGLDERETPGFAVLDLYGGVQVARQARIDFGIDNVFDRAYAEHVNRQDVFGDTIQVTEPGRAAWVKVAAEF